MPEGKGLKKPALGGWNCARNLQHQLWDWLNKGVGFLVSSGPCNTHSAKACSKIKIGTQISGSVLLFWGVGTFLYNNYYTFNKLRAETLSSEGTSIPSLGSTTTSTKPIAAASNATSKAATSDTATSNPATTASYSRWNIAGGANAC